MALGGRVRRAFRLDTGGRAGARSAVDEELRFHLEAAAEELMEQGWSETDARREAERQFGDLDETRAYCESMQRQRGREEGRLMRVDELIQDLRYGLRTLRKAPGYSGLVILTLALGVAATTVIFSIMNPYLFRPLPYANADRVVQVNQYDQVSQWDMARHSLAMADDWRERSRAFEDMGVYNYGSANVTGPEGPEQIPLGRMTDNMLEILGVRPVLGRGFMEGEDGPAGERVVLLDYGLWERRYAADPAVVGRTIAMDGVAHTVIGVMPRDFNFPFNEIKLWVPIAEDASTMERREAYYIIVGLLNDGWTADEARAELAGIQRELAAAFPDADGRFDGVSVKPLREALNFVWNVMRAAFAILLGAVLFVLMIACVNVASLTLARGSSRTREVAVRSALGARKGRIVRQLLTESAFLAVAGGGAGVLLAYWIVALIGPVFPEGLYRVGDVTVDGTVLLFSLGVTALTPLAFGLWPALRASKTDLSTALKEGSKGSAGRARTRGRRLLVMAQVAMAVVLIAGAGLMLRSLQAVQQIDLGYHADRVLSVNVTVPESSYPEAADVRAYRARTLETLRALPGVEGASAVSSLPLNHESGAARFVTAEIAGSVGEDWPVATPNRIAPGYLETMGISLLEGRGFETMDGPGADRVALVNEELRDRYFNGRSPVGASMTMGSPEEPVEYTIVGVVGNVRHEDGSLQSQGFSPQIYRPIDQAAVRRVFFVVSTQGDPAALVAPVRTAMLEMDGDLPMILRPMETVVQESHLQWAVGSVALTIFGLVALFLATLGIYGLISYSVAQRRQELGVRIALGAGGGEVRRIVLGDGLRLTGMGLVLGVIMSLGLGQLVASQLFGVRPWDPVTLMVVLTLFVAVSVAASLGPARRASRTSPMEVLRID